MGRSICVHYNYISDEKFVTVTMILIHLYKKSRLRRRKCRNTTKVPNISSEIKRDIGRKSWFYTPLHSTLPLGGGVCVIVLPSRLLSKNKNGLAMWNMFSRFYRIPACDRRTDGQTFYHGIVRAMHTRRAVKLFAEIRTEQFRPQRFGTVYQRL